MQQALVRVKGVKKATVSFEKQQATVTYDPKVATVAKMIAVVKAADHMMGRDMKYGARVAKAKK